MEFTTTSSRFAALLNHTEFSQALHVALRGDNAGATALDGSLCPPQPQSLFFPRGVREVFGTFEVAASALTALRGLEG